MAANNELENGLQESYDGVKDAANSALNAGRTAKKTVATAKKTVKKGKQAAKAAKTLFSLIPLPIKIYIGASLGIALIFGCLLYFMPSIISNTLLHQNDPESVSDGKDFSDNKDADTSYKDMEDKASECREMIVEELDDGKQAAYKSLENAAASNNWKLDASHYVEPSTPNDNQNMVLLYSGYSVSTKNGLGDEAFKHYQGNEDDQVAGLSAYNDLKNMLDSAKSTSNTAHPYGNLLFGADFERDGNGEIKKKIVKEGKKTITYVYPVVYDMVVSEVIEKAILPSGITLDTVYEEGTSVGHTTSSTTSSSSTGVTAADAGEPLKAMGSFLITRYCGCFECNGNNLKQSADGTFLTEGETIAVDPSVIPLGTRVFIEGIGWRVAHDTGGAIKGKHIDVYVSNHKLAYDEGRTYNNVYVPVNNKKASSSTATSSSTTTSTVAAAGVSSEATYRDALNEMAYTLGHTLYPNEAWIDSIGLGNSSAAFGSDSLGYFGAMWFWIEYETGKTNDDAFWYFTKDDSRGGQAYGIQYDLLTGSLQEFMKYCVKQDATKYSMFKPYLNVPRSSLYATSASDTMPTIWKAAYEADPDGFKTLQKNYAIEKYLNPTLNNLEKKGYKVKSRSDVVKGSLLSWAFQAGPYGLASQITSIKGLEKADQANKLSDEEFITKLYDGRIKRSSMPRFPNEKKTALALQRQWDSTGSVGGATLHSGVFTWPLPGYTNNSSAYGWRIHPIYGTRKFHKGEDIPAPTGTAIVAAASGKVIGAGWVSGYGNYTQIDHGNGYVTAYGHQSRIDVSVGQTVTAGQKIGAVGSTGNSTGPHLHFEVYLHDQPTDPKSYFK